MTHSPQAPFSSEVEAVHQLLLAYSVDTATYPTEAVIAGWLEQFGPVWVSHAVTEALYQGRYKLISIDQILKLWQRRGQPIRHFNREFESIILGQTLLLPTGYGESPGTAAEKPALPAPEPAAGGDETVAPPPAEPSPEPAAVPLETATGERLAIASAPPDLPLFRPVATALPQGHAAAIIPPFVPRQDASDLHERLRAVVQAGLQN